MVKKSANEILKFVYKTTCKGALNLKKREKNYNTIAQYFIDEIWANQTVMCADC